MTLGSGIAVAGIWLGVGLTALASGQLAFICVLFVTMGATVATFLVCMAND